MPTFRHPFIPLNIGFNPQIISFQSSSATFSFEKNALTSPTTLDSSPTTPNNRSITVITHATINAIVASIIYPTKRTPTTPNNRSITVITHATINAIVASIIYPTKRTPTSYPPPLSRSRLFLTSPLFSASITILHQLKRNFSIPNFSLTYSCPFFPISTANDTLHTIFFIASINATSSFSTKNPVLPSNIVSFGPPLFTAMTGDPAYMDSIGTIPKCSRLGVYTTHNAFFNK
mmetsp:Transcript_24605/g.36682  ORF Transcript_24605/g.36682 Transcript_24605/m.36682 type:complete len:233 (+) Transcript_24605:94-792(+)